MLHIKLSFETIFAYTHSDWFKLMKSIPFDQSSSSYDGVNETCLFTPS